MNILAYDRKRGLKYWLGTRFRFAGWMLGAVVLYSLLLVFAYERFGRDVFSLLFPVILSALMLTLLVFVRLQFDLMQEPLFREDIEDKGLTGIWEKLSRDSQRLSAQAQLARHLVDAIGSPHIPSDVRLMLQEAYGELILVFNNTNASYEPLRLQFLNALSRNPPFGLCPMEFSLPVSK